MREIGLILIDFRIATDRYHLKGAWNGKILGAVAVTVALNLMSSDGWFGPLHRTLPLVVFGKMHFFLFRKRRIHFRADMLRTM